MFWESLISSPNIALVKSGLAPYRQSPFVFTEIKMQAIIIEVFPSSEQRAVHLERCCTIPLMSAACLSDGLSLVALL